MGPEGTDDDDDDDEVAAALFVTGLSLLFGACIDSCSDLEG